MFERFWIEQERERHFLACFLLSTTFGMLSIFIVRYIVPFQIQGRSYSGIVSVLLASLAAAYPLIRYLEKREKEEEDVKDLDEVHLLKRHLTELETYLAFFLGTTFAFGVSNVFLPAQFFHSQNVIIGSISGKFVAEDLFISILTNNLSVFLVTFLLSFLLTAGMVFILVWNASVLGVFLSNMAKSFLHIPKLTVSYLPHGILEIGGYTLAGISGFFLSHELKNFVESKERDKAVKLITDSLLLFALGLLALLFAAILEAPPV